MKQGSASIDLEPALKTRALDAADEGIVIADIRQPDGPLIFVNQGFERLTGYAAAEVLGRNCRFLQGPATDPATAAEISAAVRLRRSSVVEILNYRKDGAAFWNRLSITPVRDTSGEVSHFIGVQSDVTARRAAEDALRSANVALEAANRRIRRGLEAAARIQRSLLPAALPAVDGVRFAYGFRPSEALAGDGLNVVRLDEDRIGLYVLDVSGHGVPAALLSVTLSRFLSPSFDRTCLLSPESGDVRSITPPAQVAELLNQRFPMDLETAQYFTLAYGVLDLHRRELRLVVAGHPDPILARPGEAARPIPCGGVPIGIVAEPRYDEARLGLVPGDRLFLYTDGVTEARDPEGRELRSDRLLEIVDETRDLPLQAAVDAIMTAVDAWSAGQGVGDDVSVLAAELDR